MIDAKGMHRYLLDRRAWLVVLFACLYLLLLAGTNENASAIEWSGDFEVFQDTREVNGRIAADGDDVYIFYILPGGSTSLLGLSWFNGVRWVGIAVVDQGGGVYFDPAIAAGNGIVHVVWQDYRDGDSDIYYSSYNGTGFSTPVQISRDNTDQDQFDPDIAVYRDSVHVVWYQENRGDYDIFYNHFNGKAWETPEVVSKDPLGDEQQKQPRIAVLDGNAEVIWTQSSSTVKSHIRFRERSSGRWSDVVELSKSNSTMHQSEPCIVVSEGKVHVAYSNYIGTRSVVEMRVYERGVWSSNNQVGGSNTSAWYYSPEIAADSGHLVLIYNGPRSNGVDVWVSHFDGEVWTEEILGGSTDIDDYLDVAISNGSIYVVGHHWWYNDHYIYNKIGRIEVAPPNSSIQVIDPYWMGTEGEDLVWNATDDWSLENISLEYRYSTDNSSWTDWTALSTEEGLSGTRASGQYMFVPSDGDGFYEFRSIARDVMGKVEASPDVKARAGLDTEAPTGAFEPFEGISPEREVQLNITYQDATSGVVKMRFAWVDTWDDVTWGDARPDPDPFTFPPESGNHTLFCQVMDAVDLVSRTFSITIWTDLDDPLCDIEIVGNTSGISGNKYVDSSAVTLSISFSELAENSGVASMRLSNDGVWDTEDWDHTSTDVTWDLPLGEGARTVHLQVMDRVGHVSEIATDTVVVDTSDPYIHSVEPDDGDTDVDVNTVITAQFSEEMDPATIGGAFSLTWVDGTQVVAVQGAFEWTQEGRTLTFTPDEPLEMGVSYHISIGQDATDIAGNGLYPAIDNSFSTSEQPGSDTEPPTGTISIGEGIFFHNSTQITIFLTYEDDTGVDSIRLSNDAVWDDEEWQTPAGSVAWQLPDGEGSRTVRYQVRDITGKVSDTYSTSFKVDMTGPRLEAMDPADGADGVAVNASIRMVFSEVLKPIPMKADLTIYWIDEDERSHDLVGELTWKSDWRTFTFEPFSDLEEGTTYYIRLGPDTQDLAGNSLYPAVSTSFTTEATGGDGNGDGDGDGDEGGISGLVIALVGMIVVLIVVVAIFMMRHQNVE